MRGFPSYRRRRKHDASFTPIHLTACPTSTWTPQIQSQLTREAGNGCHLTLATSRDSKRRRIEFQTITQVRRALIAEGWPSPIAVDSGNGAHLIYRLPDLPNDPSHTALLKNVLAGLARRFVSPLAQIDTQTYNASRLVRLAGTTNAKGDNLPERPWRRAKLLSEEVPVPTTIEPVPLSVLQAAGMSDTDTGNSTDEPTSSFIEAFAERHGLVVDKRVTLPEGSLKLVLRCCPFGGDAHKDSALFEGPDGRLGFHCFHKSCSSFHWVELRQLLEPDGADQQTGNGTAATAADDAANAPWPKPQPLAPELPPVPRFDADLLMPSPLRESVTDVAARMQVVPDLPAVAAIAAVAAAIGRRAAILPKAVDRTFIVIAVIWALLVARSGSMKSPTLLSALEPLHLAERQWHDEHKARMDEHANEMSKYEAQFDVWKKAATALAKEGVEPDAPPEKPDPPVARRVIVNHTSFEALHLALSQNPYGLLEVSDEVSSWLAELDASTNAAIRGLYLQAWTGRGDYVIDRISRGTIVARDVCLSVIGGLTPERLHTYAGNVYSGAAPDDGLLARFGLSVEPDPPPPFEYTDRAPDADAMKRVSSLLTSLLALQPQTPYMFRFSGEAQELYVDWLTKLENLIRGKDLASPLASHLAKYRSLMPGLSLIFEIASRATGSGPGLSLDPASNLVSLKVPD